MRFSTPRDGTREFVACLTAGGHQAPGMREKVADKQQRASAIIDRLDAAMPEAKIELDYRTPLELLVAVALSAQTTDKRVNLVTPALFAAFPTAAHYARATPKTLQPYIKTVGLFRNKSKNLVALGKQLVAQHGGEVPTSRAALAELAGVGLKTAGVVAIHLGSDSAFPVDTHVLRLSKRLGLSTKTKPDLVEADLQKLLPVARWSKGHQLLIWHGRRVCHARTPECHRCVVAELCPKRGVKLKKPKPAKR
jgi:endonuclease III